MIDLELSEIDQRILAKLGELAGQYKQLEERMNDPAVASNAEAITKLAKEYGRLKALVEDYYRYQDLAGQLAGAQEMVEEADSDEEMRQIAAEEVELLSKQMKETIEQAKGKLVMSDETVVGSIIIEIRAGTGGDEAALFAGDLYGMYTHYCEKRHWKVEPISFSPSTMGGFREIIFGVKGQGVWGALGYEGGGHRVQRVPETESQGRIHTSAATVAVLPEPEALDITINKEDVIEHVARASGPGGQSVNKLNSAIKLEHISTGITVSMQDEKSQHKNRAKAWRILRSRVYDKYEQEKREARSQTRKEMIGSGDRSQRIRTYNFPQNRVTDHRINLSLYSLDRVIAGEMDAIVEALIDYDKQQRLADL